jgi:hypothetical protein
VAQIALHLPSIAVDHVTREWQLVELLVPALAQERRCIARSRPGVARVQEDEPADSLGRQERHRGAHDRADVIADHDGTIDVERIEELEHVAREGVLVGDLGWLAR